MVGRTLQFQQASSPLVNIALGLLGVHASGDLILELVEMFLKAATDVSSYSQQPSPRSFVYVRTRISTAEHRVSEAAWAVQGILNICLKNKEEIYNQLSPFARICRINISSTVHCSVILCYKLNDKTVNFRHLAFVATSPVPHSSMAE
ncbi:unnamed protein product [Sphagnum jensenii]|uniref:Uncharacterized protein n=1 Tax=Sphagnum jensenii TaxID=128206 RepID=A0ABP0WTW5_9BRYO